MAAALTLVDSEGKPVVLSEALDRYSPRDIWAGELANYYPGSDWFAVARTVTECRGYYYQGVPFPSRDKLLGSGNPATYGLPPNQQTDGTLNVQPGALLVSITATSLASDGFQFRVFDKSTLWELVYGEFIDNYALGQFDTAVDAALPPIDTRLDGKLVGQYFLQTPFPIGGNGELNVSMVNLSASYNVAQILFGFAVPGSYSNVLLAANPRE